MLASVTALPAIRTKPRRRRAPRADGRTL